MGLVIWNYKWDLVLEPQIDKDGDYEHDMNGIRCNWVIYDESGKIIEPL